MSLSVNKAMTFFKQDIDWKKKFAIGYSLVGLMILVNAIIAFASQNQSQINFPLILGGMVLCFVISLIFVGYSASLINLRLFKPEMGILEWSNFPKLFIVGLKALIGFIGLEIALLIPLCIVMFIISLLTAILPIFVLIGIPLYIAAVIFVAMILVNAFAIFSIDLNLKSMFNFKYNIQLIKKCSKEYFTFIFYIILFSICSAIVGGILAITIVGILALPLLVFYINIVSCDLIAQILRDTFIDKN